MADQGSADQLLSAIWSIACSSLPGSGSGPGPGHHHHQYPLLLALSILDRTVATMDSAQHQQDPTVGVLGGDDFFIGRRCSSLSGSGSESEFTNEFSRARRVGHDGLRISGFESDEDDSDGQIVAIGDDSISNDQIQAQEATNSPSLDLNVPLCWDCLRIDDDRRDFNEEFEWEEIDGRSEEREAISFHQEHQEVDEAAGNVEWEVVLTNLGNGEDAESYLGEGFVYTNSDYDEVTFAQFQEHHDSAMKGSPPAAKSALESLPSFVLSKDDVENNCGSISCPVCKDEILVGEKAKRLPCSHCYHDQCILPWLEMRNTCPLCRYELPTDDPEYESWKARRAGNANVGGLEIVEDENIRGGATYGPGAEPLIAIFNASKEYKWLRSVIQHVLTATGLKPGVLKPTTMFEDNMHFPIGRRLHQRRQDEAVHIPKVLLDARLTDGKANHCTEDSVL